MPSDGSAGFPTGPLTSPKFSGRAANGAPHGARVGRTLLLAALVCVAPAPPAVDRFEPAGGQRGTTVEFVARGQRLRGVQGVLCERPGLEVVSVIADKDDTCKVTLRIAADCPLGAHPLRLWGERGIANPRTFHVGTLAEIAETREGSAPQSLTLETTVNGNLRGEEVDRYRVRVASGTRVRCEVEAMRLGVSAVDLALRVRSPDGRELAEADDTAHGHKDPWLAFVAPSDGDYELVVHRAFADDQNQGGYRLHVGTFPRPTLARPCGGTPGSETALRGLGDGEPLDFAALTEDHGDGFARCFPTSGTGTAPTPILLRVAGPAESTPQPDGQGRVWLEVPGAVSLAVTQSDAPAKVWFKAKKGMDLDIRVLANALGSLLDPALTLQRGDGRFVAFDDDGGGVADAYLRLQVPDDGDYQLHVRDVLRGASPLHAFRLEITPRQRSVRSKLVVQRRQDASLTVPRGGAMGGVLQVDDFDPDAGLALFARDLPPGVSATLGPLTRGLNLVPFLLTANADAPVSAALARFALTAKTEPLERDAGFAQALPLVMVRNDQPIWSSTLRRLPVATCAPAPISLQLAEIPAPLVRGGPLGVAVRVTRSKGQDGKPLGGELRLRALWTPPGVGAGQVTVAPNAEQIVLPLDANDNATLGAFPLAVIATGGPQQDPFEVASPFTAVTVDKPWLTAQANKARAAAGTRVELVLALRSERELPDGCVAKLTGLPRGASAAPLSFSKDSKELRFVIELAKDAAVGTHRGLRVELAVPHAGAQVAHRFAAGELRVDPNDGAQPAR